MASTFDVGDTVRIAVAFTDTGGTAADPSGAIRRLRKTPTGVVDTVTYSVSTGDITKASVGNYYTDVVTTATGTYWLRYDSTGTIVSAQESYFMVRTQQVAT